MDPLIAEASPVVTVLLAFGTVIVLAIVIIALDNRARRRERDAT